MTRAPAHSRREDEGRSNAEWLAQLRRDDTTGLDAQAALRDTIRRGLGRAFGKNGDLDDASLDDLTQEAMIRVTTRIESFRGDSRFTTWAMAIAIRVAYTSLRRRRWGERSLEDLGLSVDSVSPAAATPDPAGPAGRDDLLLVLRRAIESELSPRQRVAVLCELAGMPTAVIAEQLETNPNALYKLHHDARKRLKTVLEERGFSETDVRGIIEGASNQ